MNKQISSKKWCDLTINEIRMIDNIDKRKEYTNKYYSCFKDIINPLYTSINTKGYTFTDDMTCREIMNLLKEIYIKNNRTKEDIREVILGKFKK